MLPYKRDAKGVRPWIKPGTPGLMHRIGGIEKGIDTGAIDYGSDVHQIQTDARKAKIDGIAVPDQEVSLGETTGSLAVVGWGSTYGPIRRAVDNARKLVVPKLVTCTVLRPAICAVLRDSIWDCDSALTLAVASNCKSSTSKALTCAEVKARTVDRPNAAT